MKRANKETQVFTCWNDSGIYQFQHIKEQAGQAKLQQEKTMEKEEAKQESSIKKSQPETLIYSGVVVLLVITYLVYKRFF